MRGFAAPSSRRQLHFVVASLLIFAGQAAGQSVAGKPAVGQFRAVVNFSDVARQQAQLPRREPAVPVLIEEGEPPGPLPVPPEVAAAAAAQAKLVPRLKVQTPAAQAASPAPTVNFAGLAGVSFDGASHIPPDTQSAVGPNHLMITLNNGVLVQTRNGSTAKSGVSLDAFWGRSPSSSNFTFDPRVLYDPFLDRWIVVSVAAGHSTNSVLLIAMSQTNNPIGNWTEYSFPADQTAANAKTTPTLWGDFPSVGFNKTWVVVTLNLYTISNNTGTKSTIFAFDINGLLNGAATLGGAVFDDTNAYTLSPAVTFDPAVSTLYMVQSLNGNFNGSGFLRISTITGGVGSETYTAAASYPFTPNTWGHTPPSGDSAPQLNGDANHLIDAGDDRMSNVVYRNGSLWTTHAVFLPASSPTRSAVQWWQLSPTDTGTVPPQQMGRIDDSTAANFYSWPSIAVNRNNDLLLGFAHFSSTIFAEAAYSLAPFASGANTIQSPFTYKAGEAFYYITLSGTRNRWGDYSATLVDPVNDLDFWTLQEYASSTNLCSTQSPTCTGGWGTWWAKLAIPTTKKRLVQVTSD
ncbi:MAG: hypothetical protein ABSG52_04270 [Terriglobales bacterium]